MGDETASFDSKREPFRCPFIPPFENFLLRQSIKGDVELDGVKRSSIEFEPFPLRQVGRIEDPIPPVRVVIAACADENPPPHPSLSSRGRGKG
jgi:hypothetical protein